MSDCKGLCKRLALHQGIRWAELCPTCNAWVVFRHASCICCQTPYQKFQLRQNFGFEVNDQIEIFDKRSVLKVLLTLQKQPLITTELLRRAFNSGNGVEYIQDADSLDLIRRYRIIDGNKRFMLNVLTREGQEAIVMFRTWMVVHPGWEFESYVRYQMKRRALVQGRMMAAMHKDRYDLDYDDDNYEGDDEGDYEYKEDDTETDIDDMISLWEDRHAIGPTPIGYCDADGGEADLLEF